MASTDPTNVVSAYQVILLALASCGPSTSKSKQQINRASSNQIAVSMYLIDLARPPAPTTPAGGAPPRRLAARPHTTAHRRSIPPPTTFSSRSGGHGALHRRPRHPQQP